MNINTTNSICKKIEIIIYSLYYLQIVKKTKILNILL
jgi:hypothetical protein